MRTIIFITTIIALSGAISSCSGVTVPVAPDNVNTFSNPEPQVAETASEFSSFGPYSILGAWKVIIDTKTLEYEMIPSRNASAIGDIFDSDLSQFLTVSPCANCLQITGLWYSEMAFSSILNMELSMKHPFGNIAKRPDLHGFDVRAIFISGTSGSPIPDIDIIKPDNTVETASLSTLTVPMNYDGYTSHYDNLVTDPRYFAEGTDVPGNINPFLRFFESYSAGTFDPHSPSGHNVMPVGSPVYSRVAKISASHSSALTMYIIADVAYGQSAVLANRPDPQYYLPAFHRTEPWRIEYWVENNLLKYNDSNSTADVMVQVFDWQHGATVDPDYPDPSNLSGIPESSNVKELVLSMLGLQNSPEIVTSPESGSGSVSDPLQYRMTIRNENLIDSPYVFGVLAVRDQLQGKAAPSGRLPVPVSPKGFPYETDDILDYSLYYALIVNMPVLSSRSAYKNELVVAPDCQFDIGGGTRISAFHFMDWSGSKFQYRWDYDYDGVTFDVDGGGMPSPLITFSTPGQHDVGLRVRTNSVPPREYIYTIPVVKKGELFNYTVNAPGAVDMMSSRANHSMAFTYNRAYTAFTTIRNGPRHIYVAYIENDGYTRVVSACPGTAGWDYYEPTILAVPNITFVDICIAYTAMNVATSERNLLFTRANTELSSFVTGITITAQSNVTECHPCLVNTDDGIYIYYTRATLTGSDIFGSKSTDRGMTWPQHSSVDSSSHNQRNPTAVYDPDSELMYCLWQDYRDYADRGYDIYMATSLAGNGLFFPSNQNISSYHGKVHEVDPSATFNYEKIYLAYLVYDDGSSYKGAKVKTIRPPDGAHEEYDVVQPTYTTHLSPVATGYDDDKTIIAYGEYNTNSHDLRLKVLGFEYMDLGLYNSWIMGNILLGNVDSDEAFVYPALTVQPTSVPYAVRTYCAYNHFNDGIQTDPDPFPMVFGRIALRCYYTNVD